MDQDKINKDLAENDSNSSEFQRKVIESVRKYMKASADKMSKFHTAWDANSYIYRGYRAPDKDDKAASELGEPAKIIVPITYAQIQTAVSFIISTYTQRDNIFELRGMSAEDETFAQMMSRDLSYQLNDQKFVLKLYYWLLDSMKIGFGVMRVDWEERKHDMRVSKQTPDSSFLNMFGSIMGKQPTMKSVEAVESVLCYQGNKLTNVSPYSFYPDPSVTVANFQEGQFCGHEEEVALSSIEALEGDLYYGTDKIPKSMSKEVFDYRYRRVTGPFGESERETKSLFTSEKGMGQGTAVRTDIIVTLSEKRASELWGAKLGSDTKPLKWLITIINDQKVVRFEPCTYLHSRFNYEVFEFSPDRDAFFNPGLADTISELQGLVTFFLNSHIVNVRKIIANRFVVDPSRVEMDDIKNGSIYIRTKGAQGDIRRVIDQLQTSDITKNHISDIGVLQTLIQLITGISENALGQYSAGRRSATEARNVNAGSAARLKMHASLMWMQGIEPMGRQVLSNTRQWRSVEVYNSIVGDDAQKFPFEAVILADPNKIAGGYDFVAYDATLATDRQFQANVLQELFTVLIQNPQTIQLLNKDPIKLLNHIAQLYNIKNLRDFDLTPLGQPMMPMAPEAQVVPNAQAADAAGQGAQPVDVGGEDLIKSLSQ